jgi:transcription initiation factor TFIIIB Brf1 subunit/transcription initiation factor TFIIB
MDMTTEEYEKICKDAEAEFIAREKKESGNFVGKAQHEKSTEEIYKEALIAEAQEKAQADEVARIAGLSEEELRKEYDRQEGLNTQAEVQTKEYDIPWFAAKKEKSAERIRKFS